MTPSQSTSNGGPVTVAGLATELGVLPSWVADHAASLEAQRPRMPAVYLSARDGLLSGEAADAIRALYPARELYTDPQPDITVRELSAELEQSVQTTLLLADQLTEDTLTDAYRWYGSWQRGDWVLTGAAADVLRQQRGRSPERVVHMNATGRSALLPPEVLDLTARTERGRWSQFRDAVLHQGPSYSLDALQLNTDKILEPLVKIAELLIRQDMRNADPVEIRGESDQQVMDWALATAGHRFDQHELWDYDLLSDADHVHRCFTHRHVGPLTRGPVRRG